MTVELSGLKALTGEPLDGQLVVKGGETPVARAVTIIPAPQPSAPWPLVILVIAAVALVGLPLIVWGWAARQNTESHLRGPAPGPKWSFDSWATTFTAVGAIFGTVLGKLTLPTVPSQIDENTLVQLNLFFGALLAVGPFIFVAARRKPLKDDSEVDTVRKALEGAKAECAKPSENGNNKSRKKADEKVRSAEKRLDEIESVRLGLWGYSPMLLAAYSITAAAVFGELAAVTLLVTEVTKGGWDALVIVAAALLALFAAWYFVFTSYEQVSKDWLKDAQDAEKKAKQPLKVTMVDTTETVRLPASRAKFARLP